MIPRDAGRPLDTHAPDTAMTAPLRYAFGQTRLGRVLVGQRQRGICCIFLGDDEQSLITQLDTAFPRVASNASPAALRQTLIKVIELIDHGQWDSRLELDIGGTTFQQAVWQCLREIPTGQTRSYKDVALALHRPEAVRAVAGACAANVLAVVIPCHRVVRSDGGISGYRWGVERKRMLLDQERRA